MYYPSDVRQAVYYPSDVRQAPIDLQKLVRQAPIDLQKLVRQASILPVRPQYCSFSLNIRQFSLKHAAVA